MKYLLFLPLIFLLFLSLRGGVDLQNQEDYEVYSYSRRMPTREEVKATVFKDELYLAKELIKRESGDNPMAVNPTSGAAGVPQALPPDKMGCELSQDIQDYICQVKWMAEEYIPKRYGSVKAALDFHTQHGWY